MEINTDKEEGCAIGVHVSDQSSVVYISADVGDGREGRSNVRGVVYSKK